MAERKHSALYRFIEQCQGDKPWGSVLDAGTGVNSLTWIAGLETKRWTAVAGSASEAQRASSAVASLQRPQDRIVQGNWADDQLLTDDAFDTVIADYLLGAIEGFAPFFQPYLFHRLRRHVGRNLYVSGLEPYVPSARPENHAARLVWEIGRFRDACVLLKGGTPYREYPARWVIDHIKLAGLTVHDVKHFNIGYKETFVQGQINIALHGIEAINDPSLAEALQQRGAALKAEALQVIGSEGALRSCRNYVIVAEKA